MTEMRGVTDGLYLGEVVLLVLGVVLFLVLVFAFVYQLLHQRRFEAAAPLLAASPGPMSGGPAGGWGRAAATRRPRLTPASAEPQRRRV